MVMGHESPDKKDLTGNLEIDFFNAALATMDNRNKSVIEELDHDRKGYTRNSHEHQFHWSIPPGRANTVTDYGNGLEILGVKTNKRNEQSRAHTTKQVSDYLDRDEVVLVKSLTINPSRNEVRQQINLTDAMKEF